MHKGDKGGIMLSFSATSDCEAHWHIKVFRIVLTVWKGDGTQLVLLRILEEVFPLRQSLWSAQNTKNQRGLVKY